MSPPSPTLRYFRGTHFPHPMFFSICILAPTPPPLGPQKCRGQRGVGAGGRPESQERAEDAVFPRASSPTLLRWLDVGLSYSWLRDAHQHRGSLHLARLTAWSVAAVSLEMSYSPPPPPWLKVTLGGQFFIENCGIKKKELEKKSDRVTSCA